MSLFSKILGKIFNHGEANQAPASAPAPVAVPPASAPSSSAPATAAASAPAAAATAPTVDIAAVLNDLAAKNPEKLDWKHSIVDLMKLVGMESSLKERRELANELSYQGDQNDTAAMNTWLHKAVLQKLAANGGKVPADLLD